jgi:predicted kinase
MRKWMRERIKRRKKPEDAASSEPKPAPLQPAYFDASAAPAGSESTSEAEREVEQAPLGEAQDLGEVNANSTESAAAPDQPRRRRRKRGGRGRSSPRERKSPEGTESAEPTEAARTESEPQPSSIPPVPLPRPSDLQAPTAQRPSKGVVVLAIGLPGSGKSSWFKRHQITPLSSDLLRALLFDDANEQRFQDLVFSNLRSMLKARLIARRPTNYVDATNLTPQERSHWIKLAKDYGYEVHGVFFDVPLDVCLDRNRRRQRAVDEGVMQRMSAKLRAPTFEEGFGKITVVRVKKKDAEAS